MGLFKQQMRMEGATLVVWSILLALLGFIMIYFWGAFRDGGDLASLQSLMQNMPPGLQAAMGAGASMLTLQGWLQGFAFGNWMWLLYLVYVALFVTGIVTREMDRHTIDFLLGHPVSRRELLLSRWLAMLVSILVLNAAQLGGITIGILTIGEKPQLAGLLLILANSLLMFLALGTVLLIVSLFIDDYAKGVGITMGLGIGLAFYYLGAEGATGLLKTLRGWLPFAFYDSGRILSGGGVPWLDFTVLAAITGVALAVAVYLFDRKQIAA